MDTEEGDFIICGDGGSPEDIAFDTVVGVIEDFMISFDMDGVWKMMPPLHSTSGEHEQHAHYQAALQSVEKEMDAYVLEQCPNYGSIDAVGALLQKRRDDISEEVWEFVSEGCFDYEAFMELWREKKP
ncbi:putative ARF-like 2-binding protein [Leptomonas seymouri]|uniref:Putative ARF-like 2-binding protein n=1 Tax=Leptomonas seymouri TaxID=5684 RepID=A0A0N1I435_LEPSE|nr:putative ARF-like 2-binding protein [Leptomonas seymouri]|eukprot:KPI85944.1 putative ARF-like 2-binding protein [Leptomonas seymouri]